MGKVRIRAGFWLIQSLFVLILPLPWICALWFTAGLHELSHLAALRLSGVEVREMILGSDGAVLKTGPLTPAQGILCTLAGPLMPMLLLFTARWFPRIALCALIQGLYHLLPIRPLDGGRALESLTTFLGSPPWICSAAELLALCVLAALGIRLAFVGMLPAVVVFLWIFRLFYENLLAKRPGNEYNRPTKS